MAISLVAVGAKITAALANLLIAGVNTRGTASIIPASIAGSGVSLGANGIVTVSGGTTASLNGIFTSAYENYLIIVKASTIADRLSAKMRLAGVDAASVYSNQTVQGAASTPSAAVNGPTAASIILANLAAPTRTKAFVKVLAPQLAEVTDVITEAFSVISSSSSAIALLASSVNNSVQYDGITIFPDTGTWSGKIWVYGYNPNT